MDEKKSVMIGLKMQIVNSLVMDVALRLQAKGDDYSPLVDMLLNAIEVIRDIDNELEAGEMDKS